MKEVLPLLLRISLIISFFFFFFFFEGKLLCYADTGTNLNRKWPLVVLFSEYEMGSVLDL